MIPLQYLSRYPFRRNVHVYNLPDQIHMYWNLRRNIRSITLPQSKKQIIQRNNSKLTQNNQPPILVTHIVKRPSHKVYCYHNLKDNDLYNRNLSYMNSLYLAFASWLVFFSRQVSISLMIASISSTMISAFFGFT